MPTTFVAFLFLAFGVVPGFLFMRGVAAVRGHQSATDRDLYWLAQAVVASAIWLAIVYLIQATLGDPFEDWGLLPYDAPALAEQRAAVAATGLMAMTAPWLVGILAGLAAERIDAGTDALARSGVLAPPSTWDAAMLAAASLAPLSPDHNYLRVTVRLKSGVTVDGYYGSRSRANLSPHSDHDLYLETAVAYREDETGTRREIPVRGDIGGVFIAGSEIEVIGFEPPDA